MTTLETAVWCLVIITSVYAYALIAASTFEKGQAN